MERGDRILLLAGSAEALAIAAALDARGVEICAIISESPRGPYDMPVPTILIPDVSSDKLLSAGQGCVAVIDASHGFDSAMSTAGYKVAQSCDLPIVSLRRPAWDLEGRANWHSVPDVAAAMQLVAPGARVFSTTGWASLTQMTGFPGARLFLRQTARRDRQAPFDFVEVVFGPAPFDVAGETALFQELGVDTLLSRNLGGIPSRAKLDAAEALGLKVVLIERPPLPDGAEPVETVADVLAWADRL